MTEAHKRPNRHPKYKTAYRVKNWREYDISLRDHGDITLWISQDAIEAWPPPQTGKRDAQPIYSELAIEAALTFRLLFCLPLRQTEGFLGSVLRLMDLTLPCPDHTTVSRRNATVEVRRRVDRAPQGPISLIVDSSGLKVCGQGEWHAQKHGEKKVKRWKKLHLGVDDQGQIVASTVSESHEQDPSQVPSLLDQVDPPINRFVGDGMYDQEPVYAAVENHSPGAGVIIPPRKEAVLSPTASVSSTQCDQHLLEIERAGRFAWKQTSDYYDQTYTENAFSRFKRTFATGCGQIGRSPRSEKPHWLVSCSIGFGNWVVLGPIQSAKSGGQRTTASSGGFMHQSLSEQQVNYCYSLSNLERG